MSERRTYRILLVDDDQLIRDMISRFLSMDDRYDVLTADSGNSALELLAREQVDLVLSDIHMPGIRGFDLLKIVKQRYPDVKRVLITAYNVEDYLDLALNYDIGNIFVKSVPFNFSELDIILNNLLENNIFGLERHFAKDANIHRFVVRRPDSLAEDSQKIVALVDESERGKTLEMVVVELLTNAMFYGVRQENPENRQEWDFDFELSEEAAIEVAVAKDPGKYAISVMDRGGRLKKRDVLYWLHRQIAQDDKGLPLGLYDTHGRGLFIARRYIDRLIVNIDTDKRTELIVINYLNQDYAGSKPIYINEL
ncbi:MAG: response regulator [Chitinispirillia bacterium]|nr:response regulator [Chitinispirillia bacterium]MCL2242291.1 response regulator [Chitinispirillia bacterium]